MSLGKMKDDSYSPVEKAFREYVEDRYTIYFDHFSEAQRVEMRDLFFNGAAAIRDIVQNRPVLKDNAFEELDDHAAECERWNAGG